MPEAVRTSSSPTPSSCSGVGGKEDVKWFCLHTVAVLTERLN